MHLPNAPPGAPRGRRGPGGRARALRGRASFPRPPNAPPPGAKHGYRIAHANRKSRATRARARGKSAGCGPGQHERPETLLRIHADAAQDIMRIYGACLPFVAQVGSYQGRLPTPRTGTGDERREARALDASADRRARISEGRPGGLGGRGRQGGPLPGSPGPWTGSRRAFDVRARHGAALTGALRHGAAERADGGIARVVTAGPDLTARCFCAARKAARHGPPGSPGRTGSHAGPRPQVPAPDLTARGRAPDAEREVSRRGGVSARRRPLAAGAPARTAARGTASQKHGTGHVARSVPPRDKPRRGFSQRARPVLSSHDAPAHDAPRCSRLAAERTGPRPGCSQRASL